jgi:quercetin dioxygenase-like cupin family protein
MAQATFQPGLAAPSGNREHEIVDCFAARSPALEASDGQCMRQRVGHGGRHKVNISASDQLDAVAHLSNVQVAVTDGDPKEQCSSYTLRLKLSDAYTIPLHWHPDTERLTVLTGVVLFGAGDKMDPTKTTTLEPGSYIVIPATVKHWVTARGSTIFQVSGTGPFKVNFVK